MGTRPRVVKMTQAILEFGNARESDYHIGRTVNNPKSYRCHLAILREDDGAISAIVLNLPGAGSCGDTEEEAIANVREAVTGGIESYVSDGEAIPRKDMNSYTLP